MRRFLAVLLGTCLAVPAFAQTTNRVSIGDRVRVTTDGAPHIGRVVTVAPESLRVAVDDRGDVTIATPSIRTIDISRGRQSKWKTYALRGAIGAGAAGAVLAAAQHEQIGEAGSSVGKAAALGAWSGGLFGGLIGGAIGASKRADRWEQVWP